MKVKLVGGPSNGMKFDICGASEPTAESGRFRQCEIRLPQRMEFHEYPMAGDIETASEALAANENGRIVSRYDLYRATGDWVEYVHMPEPKP